MKPVLTLHQWTLG